MAVYHKSHVFWMIAVFCVVLGLFVPTECKTEYHALNCRKHSAVLTEFGGVGDGKTSNTKAFRSAIDKLGKLASDGGSQLIVPPGKWLTGGFNLTSKFTLFLHQGAEILFSQVESEYPSVVALPSYAKDGARYGPFLFGVNLTDVVITGHNGTIDGQGDYWWKKFKKGEKGSYTKPNLIEIMHSDGIQLSNITLRNSPSWNFHPVYSRNIIVEKVTILAPVEVPNTDGINPDSSTNVRIEDCYIVSGDDCIAIKSGWDEYGIKVGLPTKHVIVRRLTCISPKSSGIAIGSEMSGGIQDIRAEDQTYINTESGIRIKTAVGRGAYVKDVYVRRVRMKTMKAVFWMTGLYGSHPDNGYDKKALPVIKNINYRDMKAEDADLSGYLEGISGDPFTGICLSNVTISLSQKAKKQQWNCTDIQGVSSEVTPKPCKLLHEKNAQCHFPKDKLAIENVQLKTCSF